MLLLLGNVLVRFSFSESADSRLHQGDVLTQWLKDTSDHLFGGKAAVQGNYCINNLRQIDAAKQQWMLENKQSTNDTPTWKQIGYYVGRDPMGITNVLDLPQCPQGGTYILGRIDEAPRCTHPGHTLP